MAKTPLEDDIKTNAQGPKRVVGDEGSITQHPLPDQIEADEYLEGKEASRKKFPIRMVKLLPPGTV